MQNIYLRKQKTKTVKTNTVYLKRAQCVYKSSIYTHICSFKYDNTGFRKQRYDSKEKMMLEKGTINNKRFIDNIISYKP